MSWKDLICLCMVIVGVVLFLYGANYYDAFIGWTGVYLTIAGFLIKIVLMVWESLKGSEKRRMARNHKASNISCVDN